MKRPPYNQPSRNRTKHPTKARRYNWRKHDLRLARFYREVLWG